MISWIAAAIGMASSAPTMPISAAPTRTATMVTAGETSTERFMMRG